MDTPIRLGPRDWLAIGLVVPSFLILVCGVTLAIASGRAESSLRESREARVIADIERVLGELETVDGPLVPATLVVPVDPWGVPYRIENADGRWRVSTLGEDGAVGGELEALDVDNFLIEAGDYPVRR